MSMTMQEAMSKCPEGISSCRECPRLGDDCDGNEEYWDEEDEDYEDDEDEL